MIPALSRRTPCLGAVLLGACLAATCHAAAPLSRAPDAVRLSAADPAADRAADEEAARYVSFVYEDDSDCLLREGKHVRVRNLHPTRTVRVWLDRYYRNVGTGDRSRSDLKPGEDGEPLGCSRIDNADQEWRIVRAVFLD